MGNIQEKIIQVLRERDKEERVKDVRLGLGYTAVQLESGHTGLAFTFRQNLPGGCSVFHGLRPLAGRPAVALLPFLDSGEKIEATVGLAAANALTNHHINGAQEGDILKVLDIHPQDEVGMVGYFAPMVPELKKRVKHLTIFEKWEQPGLILPEEAAFEWLPKCQIALITSTTLLNNTIDPLLKAAASCREVVLLGTSTPLLREAFKDTPVTMLSGIEVIDPKEILQIVSEGGGTRNFKHFVRKLNLPVYKS
ncbi:MAG: DUF364 domain-containing protein [Pseudomonadota bacterium]